MRRVWKTVNIYNNLTKEWGWVEMIKEDEVMYYDNFIKKIN